MSKPINPAEKNKSGIPGGELEDIFEHENDQVDVVPEAKPEPIKPEIQPDSQREQEVAPETVESKPDGELKENEMSQIQPAPQQDQTQPVTPPTQKSMEVIKIENILSENLDELFLTMTPQQQMQFKEKGEETAEKINILLNETKVKVKEVILLIKEWLKIIPGVNKFFLEQEAKIKTDRLLNLREQKIKNQSQ